MAAGAALYSEAQAFCRSPRAVLATGDMSNPFDDFDNGLDDDVPSHTSVTMKLAIIQKRCSELLEESEAGLDGLSLEEDKTGTDEDIEDAYNPYGRD